MTISIGSDHAGYELRLAIKEILDKKGINILDRGTASKESVDYPDFAEAVAADINSSKATFGILICSTGIGISISANKIKGIRAALVYNEDAALYARKHNDANILCLGARYQTPETAQKILDIFINTNFEGGRHERRINKIKQLENNP